MGKRFLPYFAIGAIVVLACVLYIPFLGNPMVFDDLPFFSSGRFAYFATSPVGLDLRLLPYFTLAFPQVVWGHFPPWNHAGVHRIISLAFHVACALAFYRLLHDLVLAVRPDSSAGASREVQANAYVLAFIGAAVFAIHPVAVYGAGYLVQRTILLATLFSLLSIIFFMRGLTRGRHADAIAAAVFYTLAVFSKEHSVLLPAVAVMATPLVAKDSRFAIRHIGIYLLACLPAALGVVALIHWVIGKAYEPNLGVLSDEIQGIAVLDVDGGPWLVSAITQAGLFFEYLRLWIVPDTGAMSIDMRVDFSATWSAAWIALKVMAFAGFGMLGLFLLSRRGKAGLIGFGVLYAWILFAVELSSVRFQEPFVLYRSYLWAPGFLIMLVAVLSILSRKAVAAFFVIACPVLLYQAHDRLQSFSSNLALWEDAAEKLPATPVPLGSRVLFGMAREQVYAGRLDLAAQTANRCIAQYPRSSHCNFSRGAVHAQLREYDQALVYLDRALVIEPKSGLIHTHRGVALERLGRLDEARAAYRRASQLGFIGGDYRLGMLDDPGDGRPRVLYDASRSRRKAE